MYDTVEVSNPLSDNKTLIEFLWNKRWCSVDPIVNVFLVPKGAVIDYEVYVKTDERGYVIKWTYIRTITKNDFLVVNSDINFFHPEKRLNNLFYYTDFGDKKLIKKANYEINQFPMLMKAKEADEFIEFAPLNVWEINNEMPYLISSLEEWEQKRSWNIIKDDDIVYFKRNGAMSHVGRIKNLTLGEFFRYHDPGSEAPIVYIEKDGELVALIGQEGRLWGTRKK